METTDKLILELRDTLAQLPRDYSRLTEQELIRQTAIYVELHDTCRAYDGLLEELVADTQPAVHPSYNLAAYLQGMQAHWQGMRSLAGELMARAKAERKPARRAALLHALLQLHEYIAPLPDAHLRWLLRSMYAIEQRFAQGRLKGDAAPYLQLILDEAAITPDFEKEEKQLAACLRRHLPHIPETYTLPATTVTPAPLPQIHALDQQLQVAYCK